MSLQQVIDLALGQFGGYVLCLVAIFYLYRLWQAAEKKVDELQALLLTDGKDNAELAKAYLKLAQGQEQR